jgi:hypothetical protein
LADIRPYTAVMKIVGKQLRSELAGTPQEAFARSIALDAMLPPLLPAHPRGVFRGTHAEFNRRDDAHMREVARRLNPL